MGNAWDAPDPAADIEYIRADLRLSPETVESMQRIAELEAEVAGLSDQRDAFVQRRTEERIYSIALQRLIERFCREDLSTFDRLDAPHHYDMLSDKLKRIAELEAENEQLRDGINQTIAAYHAIGRLSPETVERIKLHVEDPDQVGRDDSENW